MKTPPTITAVIPAYNSAATIVETVASALQQSAPPAEIVVVDDASSDGTGARLEAAFCDRIRLLRRPANSGTADIPRAAGVEAARTEWVALLDADDAWDADKLRVISDAIAAEPEIPFWHHLVRVVDAQGTVLRIRHEGNVPSTGRPGVALLERCFICTSAVVVRRAVWLAALDRVRLGAFGTEWDIFLAIAHRHPIGLVNRVLGSYRYAADSVSRRNWRRYSRDVVGMMRIYRNGLWKGIVSRRGMKTILRDAFREDAELHRHQGHSARALWFCAQGMRYAPFDGPLAVTAAKSLIRLIGTRP